MKRETLTERFWSVKVYGLGMGIYDPVVASDTPGGAKYATYKAAREAGYYQGKDGFFRFLLNAIARPATESEIRCAPRLAGRQALADREAQDHG